MTAGHENAEPLARLERAFGLPLGLDARASSLPSISASPREAIGSTIRAALEKQPCHVSFSGGRDSSVVLALAVREAREASLPPPVPITLRFPGRPLADEASWQERVIAHLGLCDWERVDIHDELDFLGLSARESLERFGLLWPPNAHYHLPIFRRARGGTVMTGFDGDGLLSSWRWERAQAVLGRAVRPEPRDVLRIALAIAPHRVRTRFTAPRTSAEWAGWLRPDARRVVEAELARDEAAEPRRWDAWVDHYSRSRFHRLPQASLRLLAAACDVRVVHPLADPGFLGAVARSGGSTGFGSRTAATQKLFGDLLPPELVGRPSKGEFGAALWGPDARAFAESWDGSGIDNDLVDAHVLRETWREENPPLACATLIQAAWLAKRKG